MSESEATFPYGAARPPEHGGSDLLRFSAFILAGLIVLGALFLLIRAMQESNSQTTFDACVTQVDGQDNPVGSRPEDFCQQPN